ncbi:MAG: thioredoxin family protein [Chloroflexi bacterium]|nr:thioredoxin family protein [Chloroflexota bacterium]
MSNLITAEQYASGMTFDEYVAFLGSPENLRRQANAGPRQDLSGFFRDAFEQRQLTADQEAALQWIVAQPNGPAKMLVISEEWSSDCRRDVPTFARIAAVTGMELRIFLRDGDQYDRPSDPDIMAAFLNHKKGQAFRSIPVCAFFTNDLELLYQFTEYAAIYDKDRVVQQNIRAPKPGESPDETRVRAEREFGAVQQSPFWRIWTSAAVDEIVSALHRRAVLGVL